MTVYCVFSLESPHRGNSNEDTKYTIFSMQKKILQNYPYSADMGFFSNGFKNEFETAVVNEPSVFEPLNVYCSMRCLALFFFFLFFFSFFLSSFLVKDPFLYRCIAKDTEIKIQSSWEKRAVLLS